MRFRYQVHPYRLILWTLSVMGVFAFFVDRPLAIMSGLVKIYTSRSILMTDYIVIGGLGAALVNAALVGFFGVWLLHLVDAKLNGSLIMAIFLTVGFSFMGKTVFNMLPIIGGVWLYSLYRKEPFINYSLIALLGTTLTPIVSEAFFTPLIGHPLLNLLIGISVGLLVGFFIPVIASSTNRVHGGYNLYNVGFAAGILALFVSAFAEHFNIHVQRVLILSEGNNLALSILMYTLSALWCVAGLLSTSFTQVVQTYKRILTHTGRLVTDYFMLYKEVSFINVGILSILGTTVVLVLGAQLNAPVIAGIFTMAGFAVFGKHPKNCLPLMAGAIFFAYINHLPLNQPANIIAILFCTGLAPIAGQYGWFWGVWAGILHIIIVGRVGLLAGGLNLYNNGFAAGFVAIFLLPVIQVFRRKKDVEL